MRIDFSVEGGVGAFPGLADPVSIRCDALPAQENAQLRDMVRRAGFFALPAQGGASAPGAADTRAYTIAIDDGGKQHTVKVSEPIADPALRALVSALRERARLARRARSR